MASPGPRPERPSSLRSITLAVFAFVILSVGTLRAAERGLQRYFEGAVAGALKVRPAEGSVSQQIREGVAALLEGSPWTRIGGVEVRALVIGADGTLLYPLGRRGGGPEQADPRAVFHEAARVLPASADVAVELPLGGPLSGAILALYGTLLVQLLFLQYRRATRRERQRIEEAVAARNEAAERAAKIEGELERVRSRLAEVEPSERAHADEIRRLQGERGELVARLRELAARESELRAQASRASELDQERQSLEELLEEAMEDLGQKDAEIQSLQDRLRSAARATPAGSARQRAAEHLGRRLRTLYKALDFDERAIQDLLALGDETLRLRAEEAVKRLCDEPETAAVRRKVGGLPAGLAVFELAFAGKGRIYYARGEGGRHRILAVGAKNTQNADLEYLARSGRGPS
jgi:predicted nuclease with TOPRIM domain